MMFKNQLKIVKKEISKVMITLTTEQGKYLDFCSIIPERSKEDRKNNPPQRQDIQKQDIQKLFRDDFWKVDFVKYQYVDTKITNKVGPTIDDKVLDTQKQIDASTVITNNLLDEQGNPQDKNGQKLKKLKELFYKIIKYLLGNEKESDQKTFIKNCAIVLTIKNQCCLLVDEQKYKCQKELSDFFEIEQQIMSFIIDLLIGTPEQIFKIENISEATYQLNVESIDCFRCDAIEVDEQRVQLLENLLNCNRYAVLYSCFKWYHQQQNFQAVKEQAMPIFENEFNVSQEYVEIVWAYLHYVNEDNDEEHGQNIKKLIVKSLRSQFQNMFSRFLILKNSNLLHSLLY